MKKGDLKVTFTKKLMQLRKQNGYSQEELAQKLDITRQSISKWESGQSVPDLKRIIQLSKLFNVSTDYLLKDNIETVPSIDATTIPLRQISMSEATTFLDIKTATSKAIAFGIFLCIIAPICLLILSASSLPENTATTVGLVVLLLLVALAVAIFIASGHQSEPFTYLDKENFETYADVRKMVTVRRAQYKNTYTKNNIIGSCSCILAALPIIIGSISFGDNDLLLMLTLAATLVLAGIGTGFFIHTGIIWVSFEKLLQTGDYSKSNKDRRSIIAPLSMVYWLVITAIYLGYSFATNNWYYSWLIWLMAVLLYPAIINLLFALSKKLH